MPRSAGWPRNRSGMKTWYGFAESAYARMSAPCLACMLKPKISYTMKIAVVADEDPVVSLMQKERGVNEK